MRYSKDLIGKTIVSIDDGRNLGTVRDVYLDQNLEWLAGIYLGREGLISRKTLVIPREAIAVFGVDYVLTKSGDVVTDEKQLSDVASWLRLDQLQGREVDST
ncbi:MAG: PRC-barrel domain-containing protein, partial [Chloroflexota bacterium]